MTQQQIIRSIAYGVVFWFIAAMTVHLLPQLFDGGLTNALVLVGSIPVAWLSIPISLRACGVEPRHALDANVIAIIAATFADGVGITFVSDQFYAGVGSASQFGAAWILWGVGWILLFAWQRRDRA